jgi:hypothetical protein
MGYCEFSPTPNQGIGLQDFVDELNSEQTSIAVRAQLLRLVRESFPEIEIIELNISNNRKRSWN